MPDYKVRGGDGKEYGPVSAEVLRQWIREKRADAATSVLAGGETEWRPLSSLAEFADALGGGPPVLSTPAPSGPAKTSGLAIASLVCGVLGFLFVPALAGVVLGIVALLKISQSRGQLRGQGMAIVGICLSGLMMFALVPAAMLLPALARAKARAERIHCVNNLKQVCLAARIYATDNREVLPLDFRSMSNSLGSPKVLVCPADKEHIAASSWATFDPRQNVSYEYLRPGRGVNETLMEVVFRCPIHDNVGMGDGSVQQRPRGPK